MGDFDAVLFLPPIGGYNEHTNINILRKEVIHRQLPLPVPCYDFAPVTDPTFARPNFAVKINCFVPITA